MNKTELINSIYNKTEEINKKDIETILNTALDTITETLASGEKVSLVGFGNFEVRERAARKGRNPQSGEEIDIPASKASAWKPSKNVKELVNQ